jgi:hypothetical protein
VLRQLSSVPPALERAAAAAARGDILPLRLLTLDVQLAPCDGAARSVNAARDPIISIVCTLTTTSGTANESRGTASSATATDAGEAVDAKRMAFLLAGPAAARQLLPSRLHAEGVTLCLCQDESSLLLTWHDWVAARDPDALATFQVRMLSSSPSSPHVPYFHVPLGFPISLPLVCTLSCLSHDMHVLLALPSKQTHTHNHTQSHINA